MVKRKLLLHFIDAGLENFALGVKSHDAPDVGLGFERSLHKIGFDALKLKPVKRELHLDASGIFRSLQHHLTRHQITVVCVVPT